MNKKILPYIRHISRRNMIAPFIILAFMILLLIVLPVRSVLLPQRAESIDAIHKAASSGVRYIHIRLASPEYTGYDYVRRDKTAASYYYLMDENMEDPSCVFLLIPAGGDAAVISENASSDSGSDTDIGSGTESGSASEGIYEANARIILRDRNFDSFLDEYARDIGWTKGSLTEISGGFLVSSYNYHSLIYIITFILICLISLI